MLAILESKPPPYDLHVFDHPATFRSDSWTARGCPTRHGRTNLGGYVESFTDYCWDRVEAQIRCDRRHGSRS